MSPLVNHFRYRIVEGSQETVPVDDLKRHHNSITLRRGCVVAIDLFVPQG